MAQNAVKPNKTVASPIATYETMAPTWTRNRAIMAGERYIKDHDSVPDIGHNLLIPFSPSMTPEQYAFFKAEAETPGIVSTYVKMMIGGLLRKPPQLTLPEGIPEEAKNWLLNEFGEDGCTLSAFLDECLAEELTTSRAWIHVDYPSINADALTVEQLKAAKPFPVVISAESVINWRLEKDPISGERKLTQVIVRVYEERFNEAHEFHTDIVSICYVHELVDGYYRIRKFEKTSPETNVPVVSGTVHQDYANKAEPQYVEVEVIENILMNNERLRFIPLWPLNGSYDIIEPVMNPLIEKEVHLYNKMSRRNHLLYNTATYTPVISTDMVDEEFDKMVSQGLGTWIKLRQGDTASVLEVPSDSLEWYNLSISAAIEEMAKLGIRMLTPETTQSGVALDIRNAAQNAQIGTLSMKVCATLRAIFTFMLNWRYGYDLKVADVNVSLSTDFNTTTGSVEWLKLATQWYESGLIPRSAWLLLLKRNDMLEPDYDDGAGSVEITNDELVITKREQQGIDESFKNNGA